MTQGYEIIVLTIIPALFFLFRGIFTGGNYAVAINYVIGGGIVKTNRRILTLLIFPILVAILPVKYPCTLTIITICAPLVLLIVAGHGGRCQIFGI